MLIRLIGHFKNNPKHVDKMIAIKGLPEEWIFREGPNGKELAHPWKADVDANIPLDIRRFCEPTYLTFRFPPIEKGANWVIDHKQILGIVLNYMTQPGKEMWDQVERLLEGTVPRDMRVPQPVVLAKDEHGPFETYLPKRDSANHLYLEPCEIPEIDLRPYLAPKTRETKPEVRLDSPPPLPESKETPDSTPNPVSLPETSFKCESCDYTHRSKQGIRMHVVKKHPKKEKVGVS